MQNNSKYYIPINGKPVEVSKEVYTAFYQMDRRERYLSEVDRENGLLSYNSFSTETTPGEEFIYDATSLSMEEKLLTEELHNLLHRCINALPKADRDLIEAIYYKQKSEHTYGQEIGISQNSVNYRHNQVLSKLKKLLNIIGCFWFFSITHP